MHNMSTGQPPAMGRSGQHADRRHSSLKRRQRPSLAMSVMILGMIGTFGRAEDPELTSTDMQLDTTIGSDHGVALFSAEWDQQYRVGEPGCGMGRGSYTWRPYGFGSNMNNMLNAWVYALSVEKWDDIALVNESEELGNVGCFDISKGQATAGWHCLFSPMPHLCPFESNNTWVDFMRSRDVSQAEQAEAVSLTLEAVRFAPEAIVDSLRETNVDHLGALAAVAKYLWSNMTPWLKAGIDDIGRENADGTFGEGSFIGIHVRRGDKVSEHEARMVGTEEYLSAAVDYLRATDGDTTVEDIEGIWLASDDASVFDEIIELAPKYFPNLGHPSRIVWVSRDGGLATHTNRQHYESFLYLLADLHQLARAEVFVGTYSSNLGRLVAVLREGNGRERASAVSMDRPTWYAGRRARRVRRGRRSLSEEVGQ